MSDDSFTEVTNQSWFSRIGSSIKGVLVGIVLVVIGGIGWAGSGGESATALIPAFFGVPLAVLGLLAKKPERRKLFMHLAVLVGLLGAIGSGMRGIPNAGKLISGDAELPLATAMQLAMFVVCAVFVAHCVRSFINARKNA